MLQKHTQTLKPLFEQLVWTWGAVSIARNVLNILFSYMESGRRIALTKYGGVWRHRQNSAAVVSSGREWSLPASSIFNLWTPECASPPPYWLLSWLEEIENILRSDKKRKCALKIIETGANLAKAYYKHRRDGKEEKQAARGRPEGACAWTADRTEEPSLSRRCSWRWRGRCWAG